MCIVRHSLLALLRAFTKKRISDKMLCSTRELEVHNEMKPLLPCRALDSINVDEVNCGRLLQSVVQQQSNRLTVCVSRQKSSHTFLNARTRQKPVRASTSSACFSGLYRGRKTRAWVACRLHIRADMQSTSWTACGNVCA
jgi:hypothetical protein